MAPDNDTALPSQAVLKAGVQATSEALQAAMLRVPLQGGAVAAQDPRLTLQALKAVERALEMQGDAVAVLLSGRPRPPQGDSPGFNSDDEEEEEAEERAKVASRLPSVPPTHPNSGGPNPSSCLGPFNRHFKREIRLACC